MNDRCKSKKWVLFCSGVAIFCLLSTVRAELNQTPKGTEWYVFAPYRFATDGGEEDFIGDVSGQGYNKGFKLMDWEPNYNKNEPTCKFDKGIDGAADGKDFIGLIQAAGNESPGVILIRSEGGYGIQEEGYAWVSVESFRDKQVAWDRWDDYASSDEYSELAKWKLTVTEAIDKEGEYGIYVRDDVIFSRGDLAGTACVVHVAACKGAYFAGGFPDIGARVAMGPDTNIYTDANTTAIRTLGNCLAGHEGPANREITSTLKVVEDHSNSSHYSWGNTSTTLAPCVPAGAPAARYVCNDDNPECLYPCSGAVNFDTKMVETDPYKVLDFGTDGCVSEDDVSLSWVEGQTAHGINIVYEDPKSSGSVTVTVNPQYAVSANNSRQLDGNTEQANAVGPNGDAFQWEVTCSEGSCEAQYP